MDAEEKWKDYYLDEFGKLVFQSLINPNIFAHRTYHWVDIIAFADEAKGRKYLGQLSFSKFEEELIKDNWILITKEEAARVKADWREITAIRRDLKIDKILE